MFTELLDSRIAAISADPEPHMIEALYADEIAALLPRAVQKRRLEFAAGRYCARIAMAGLGWAPTAVTVNQDRAPIWPAGLVGSITHSVGYAAAAVAQSEEYAGLGIDAEALRDLEPALCSRIANDQELAWIAATCSQQPSALMLFSAKECLHKCLHPLTGIALGFLDAEVTPGDREFQIHFPYAGSMKELSGRWTWDSDRVYATVSLSVTRWREISGG